MGLVYTGTEERTPGPRLLVSVLIALMMKSTTEYRMKKAVVGAALVGALAVGVSSLIRRGTRWGSTEAERMRPLPGDDYLEGGPAAHSVMTRAIFISAPPEVVWPWLAQLGRGAGWYSYDLLDNGGRTSARHIVSWIPGPQVGDAAAVGWLRNIEPGRALTWWLPADEALGTTMRMVTDWRLEAAGGGTRLIVRIAGDATGTVGPLVIRGFEIVDSIMAIRQLRGIKQRAEAFGTRTADPKAPETGARDQFQLYETIWNTGQWAGVPGREKAILWRQDAEAAGIFS